MVGASGDPSARQSLIEADVVLALGNSFSKWQTWRWAEGLYDHKTLLQINIDKVAINRVYPPDLALISDVKPAIVGIMQELEKRVEAVEKASPVIQKHYGENIHYTGNKVHPGELTRAISQHLPANSIILGDAGGHMLWLAAYMQLNQGQNYQNPGIFGPMASNVNAAIGVQCANPNRRVIVGCGDMGYQMAGFELMTAIQYKIPVVWIIFNNGEYNVIKMMQKRNYGKEAFNSFLNPDFVAYARACGARGYRIEKLSDFDTAFQEALAADQPALIDVVVDPNVYPPFGLIDGSLRKQSLANTRPEKVGENGH
jgi:acetolactate synthase-1/2/3 large subunit